MKDKQWYRDRISELELRVKIKVDEHNSFLIKYTAFISVIAILFIFELQRQTIIYWFLIMLGILFVFALIKIDRKNLSIKKETNEIKFCYNKLLNR